MHPRIRRLNGIKSGKKKESKERMKVLLMLWGESYRSGVIGQTRDRGTGDYKRRQRLASQSHIRLLESLREKGHDVDIFLNTYALNEVDDMKLKEFYSNQSNLLDSKFYSKLFPQEIHFFINMFDIARSKMHDYDCLLFIRLDLYLKKYCIETFSLDEEKLCFAHIDSNIDALGYNSKKGIGFQIAQVIITIPKSLFWVLEKKILDGSGHPHWFRNNLVINDLSLEKIGFLVSSPFVCSTCTGWNPLYIQVGRQYNTDYTDTNPACRAVRYWYDADRDMFVEDYSKTLERWKPFLEEDSLEENLNALSDSLF